MDSRYRLHQGAIEERVSLGAYYAKDIFSGEKIFVTLLASKRRMSGFSLEIGDIIYMIVPPFSLLFTTWYELKGIGGEEDLMMDKEKLEKGINPLI